MDEIPPGRAVGDIIPAFAGVESVAHVGEPNADCACCRKPFTAARKARREVRLFPYASVIPLAFSYRVCGACLVLHQAGGVSRDGFLAAVEKFHHGETAVQ